MDGRAVGRQVRGMLGTGVPLGDGARRWLESCFGTGLGAVRVHTGPDADGLARYFGADAFTVGADVFFRAGRLNSGRAAGQVLLAHEVAHAVHQAAADPAVGPDRVVEAHSIEEYAADHAAALAVRGQAVPGPVAPARRPSHEAALVVACHSSWEHRMLGECNTDSLDIVAKALQGKKKEDKSGEYLKKLRQYLLLWETDPESVTEEQIKKHMPDLRLLRLKTSGLLVTYGELNTLADYLPEPITLDAQPKKILLPILQSVRQETYNKIGAKWLLDDESSKKNFKGSIANWQWGGFFQLILETKRLNDLTKNVGTNGKDHYYGLLARNACHFAPYSWHRWYQYHMIARDYAKKFWAQEGPWGEHLHHAWLYAGYADHFLQDSFAAGHLINKTMVMQWFVDWVKDKRIAVHDWEQVKLMTAIQQPRLAPQAMYDHSKHWPYLGVVKDPETAQEKTTKSERQEASGLTVASGAETDTVYGNYLAFLANAVVQGSTAVIHDHLNAKSLWVSSTADTEPYQVWGDDTMLTSGDGVRIASKTAQEMSQQAIDNIRATGNDGGITPQKIRDRLPIKVGDTSSGLMDLDVWHATLQRDAYGQLFGSAWARTKYAAVYAAPGRLGKVSVDDNYTN
ncbi:eCIS core domain-containing protein [Streptomyces rectiverticillatus]|uniref:eCIS core domain-containing protein n=1 Tax=Streptomyces rectiverticillatus TaxID=173860 RepID=UPI001FE78716|nr:DUF4157 domain-containing protein [Streptomyces rectiverticillatus]